MKQYKILIVFALVCGSFLSCSKWLDVQPTDRVTEGNAFSTPQSFKQALNGIYIELNREAVYGKALTSEFIDILAQYYAIHPEATLNQELTQYNYTGSGNLRKISDIWATMYNIIANTNLIIKNSDERRDVLSDDYYGLIKGEALALRAMLHFDLFRLFGPNYSKGVNSTAIPYYTEFVLDVNPSASSDEFLEQVIHDLNDAIELLSDDPIIAFGPKGDPADNFKQFRTLRLNYYAAKALLARVYLYAEENELALATAKEVMAVQETWFPWVKAEEALADRVFSTEILFSLQNIQRRNLFTSLFDAQNLQAVNALTPQDYVTLGMFEYERHDYRFMANLQNTVLIGSTTHRIFEKYAAPADSLENQLIPMIRMSEVFYIAAETEPVDADGLKHLQTVRRNRGIANNPADSYYFKRTRLLTEHTREFWGEGQLFYYFKRTKATEIQSPHDEYSKISIQPANYILPIPEGETKYN